MNARFFGAWPILIPLVFFLQVHAGEAGFPEGMVLIPGGEWMSGEPGSRIKKTLPEFYIDRYELTQEEYERVMGNNPSFFKGADRPVEKVTWFQADDYCRRTGKRLPTEWEWEKAARGDGKVDFSKGPVENLGWFKDNAGKETHPVGKKSANPYGLYDMAGNVWEWTSSDHESGGKVLRGGSWRNSADSMRPSKRIMSLPIHKFHYVGFRCVRSAVSEP